MIKWFKSLFSWTEWSDVIYSDGDTIQVKFNTFTWEAKYKGLSYYSVTSKSAINEINTFKKEMQEKYK